MLLLKTSRETLLAPLQTVSGIVEKRHTLPILSNVLIEKKGAMLTMVATDIEIQITTGTALEGGAEGAVTVGARKLQDILRSLPEASTISLDLDEKRLVVKSGKSRFSLQTLPAEDFPQMNLNAANQISFSLPQKAFKQLLGQTQYAMAAQDVRYYLNGMLLQVEGTALRSIATDGHRLAFAQMDIAESLEKQEVILPRKSVLELARLLADSEEPLNITLANNQARFSFGDVVFVSKLIDGKFPDYSRVIPPSFSNELSLNRIGFSQALQRARILSNEKFSGVRLILETGVLKISAANAEQEEAQEEIEVDYNGDRLDIGFNVNYLLDVLSHVSDENVVWRFNDANSSALFGPADSSTFKYVVMPMRI
jgi:DNA polymerase-3 subunit beta